MVFYKCWKSVVTEGVHSKRDDLQISETSRWRLIKDVSEISQVFSKTSLSCICETVILGLQTKALFIYFFAEVN